MSAEEFLDELTFYEMGTDVINKYIDTYCPNLKRPNCSETVSVRTSSSTRSFVGIHGMKGEREGVKHRLWEVFDKPETSAASRTVAGIQLLTILNDDLRYHKKNWHFFVQSFRFYTNGFAKK